MDLYQLRCFLSVADTLHFGRAAQRMNMLPSALGRHIRLLEESLGAPLFLRTTRSVMLTTEGAALVADAKALVEKADAVMKRFRGTERRTAQSLRIGAIDTAAAGLLPQLIHDFRKRHPRVEIQLIEDKTTRLLPRLLYGKLDLAFVRPPEKGDPRIEFAMLLNETPVVAMPQAHPLAKRKKVTVPALADEPLIVPSRRSRPHSHDLTIKLFDAAGLRPQIAQIAEEKQTIVSLVAAKVGLAILPRWASRLAVHGVRYVPLEMPARRGLSVLPLAAAWLSGSRDPLRIDLVGELRRHLSRYAANA